VLVKNLKNRLEDIFQLETAVTQFDKSFFRREYNYEENKQQSFSLPSKLNIRPSKLLKNNGFYILVELNEKRIDVSIIFEEYARNFLNSISNPDEEKINRFTALLVNSSKKGYKYKILINNKESNNVEKLLKTEGKWTSIDISLYIPFIDEKKDYLDHLYNISEDIYGLILSLVDLEEIQIDERTEDLIKYPEGNKTKILVNKYERNRLNRKCCLDHYGYNCMVCNMNFMEKYNEIGKNYIHVHHTILVSEIGEDYIINPIKDLVPVCPNCHAMLHKRNPPYSIKELKDIIKS
jgi:5-methylcytosine-specific restriction enzyme A